MSEVVEVKNFAELRFIGPRFEGGGMPLVTLAELSAYRELLVEVARAVFLSRQPTRQRVPKNFADGFDLRLVRVDSGSAIPVLQRHSAGLVDVDDVFTEARDLVFEVVAASAASAPLPSGFPAETLTQFNRFGRTLRGDELIEMRSPTSKLLPQYTKEVRRSLILQKSDRYQRDWILIGTVSQLDDHGTFQLKQRGGRTIAIPYEHDLFDRVRAALRPVGDSPMVRVEGIAILDVSDTVHGMESVHDFEIVPAESESFLEAVARLAEVASLEDGWLDGAGDAPSVASATSMRDVLELLRADELPMPHIYPAQEGGIRFEWTFDLFDVTVEAGQDGTLQYFAVADIDEHDVHHERIAASDAIFLLRGFQ